MLDGYKYKKGDKVKWVGPPKTVNGTLAITTNDIREVVEVKPGVAILSGKDGKGTFGWVSDLLIERMPTAA